MTNQEALHKIETLRRELNEHNYRYYVLSDPSVSDFDFDLKIKALEELELKFPQFSDENSPTKRVGGAISPGFDAYPHRSPMMSLSNSYSLEEIEAFHSRILKAGIENPSYVCELKYDGVAISISYKNGRLFRALTRGDGLIGEEVTQNIRTIKSIPLVLKGNYPDEFEIRGEVVMPFSSFDKLNQQREAQGLEPFMNPRNTASGTLKLQDSAVVATRALDCFLYALQSEDFKIEQHFEAIEMAASWGFKVPQAKDKFIQKCHNLPEIEAFISYWEQQRHKVDFAIDGIVIKINDISQQNNLGLTAKSPRWAIAYKYPSEKVVSVLQSVSFQVGRTGAVTPVANLSPVLIAGTMVKRASLHNADQILKLDLHLGDKVYVEKGGEIIPKITGVDKSQRTQSKPIEFIEKCPECGSPLSKKEGEAAFYCLNYNGCAPQIKGRIIHFIGRKAMDIDGLGNETVDLLYEKGLIKTPADLYHLQYNDLIKLDRMAEKSVNNLLNGIERSKAKPFHRVLFAMGIRYVGETIAKKLTRHFISIENLMKANHQELIDVPEIGDQIASSLMAYFSDQESLALLLALKECGLKFTAENSNLESKKSILDGKVFVISGVFQAYSREGIKESVENNGGKITASVSSKTDYLLAGEGIGPSKKEKATALGITIISEQDYINMIA